VVAGQHRLGVVEDLQAGVVQQGLVLACGDEPSGVGGLELGRGGDVAGGGGAADAVAGLDPFGCLGQRVGGGQGLFEVQDLQHVYCGTAAVGLGEGRAQVSVLDAQRDAPAGLAVDEPGHGPPQPAHRDRPGGVVGDRLVLAPVCSREGVRPRGEPGDPVVGHARGHRVAEVGPGFRGLGELAGEQPLPAGQLLQYRDGAVDQFDHRPGLWPHLTAGGGVAVGVGDALPASVLGARG